MTFERPAEGNPHQFTIKQHFHTAHSIGKFHDHDNKLDVYIKEPAKLSEDITDLVTFTQKEIGIKKQKLA